MNGAAACLCLFAGIALAQSDREQRYFDTRVAPILIKRCLGCPNQQLNNANISFEDRGTLLKGGPRGPTIVPRKPEKSVLVDALRHEGELQMPPGPKLPAKEIAVLTEWI